ncbi:hypothetical protein GBA52_009828 [Prunus armeniaca]|nr:hypothetical protein GBA52_009828 [Prunus armeniaca]
MEKKGVNMGAAMASLVLLVTLIGRSTAVDNPDCYASCLPKCVKGSVFGSITCAGTCIAQCLASSPSLLIVYPKTITTFVSLDVLLPCVARWGKWATVWILAQRNAA